MKGSRWIVGTALLSLLALSISQSVPAQRLAANTSARVGEQTAVRNALATLVSVDLASVSLETALETIERESGVRLFYSRDVLPLSRRVSVHGDRITLGAALKQALEGTGAEARVADENRVVITPASGTQAQGTITGKIVNAKTKQPIVGVTVVLDDNTKGVTTGEDGTFRLPAPIGEHTVSVRGLGFVKQSRRVTVVEGQSIVVDVQLEPSASVLNEVIVTGTVVATERKAIPTPITVIKAEDIEKRGITRIEQLFRGEVPGLLAAEQGSQVFGEYQNNYSIDGLGVSSKIYSRGSANLDGKANPIKTYVDGIELLDPSYLGTIDPRSIERIEIITGPQAATIYGSGAMGGVMQIFTKKGNGASTPDLTLTLRYGTMESNVSPSRAPKHSQVLTATGGNGPSFSYSTTFSHDYMGQWLPNLFARTLSGSAGATHVRGPVTVNASFSLLSSRNGTYNNGFGSIWDYQGVEDGRGLQFNRSLFNSQRISTSSNQIAALGVDYRPFSFWQHHLTAGRSVNTFALDPQRPVFERPEDSLYKVRTTFGQRTTVGYNMTLVAGAGPLSSTFTLGGNGSVGEQRQIDACSATKSQESILQCSPWLTMQVNKTKDEESWGGFGSWQIGLLDQLYLTFGLRGEHNPAYGADHKVDWTPTNGLTYTFERGDLSVKLLGSYGKATRPPLPDWREEIYVNYSYYTPSQLIGQLGNPYLTPEYSSGPQGGIEIYFANLFSVTVNHYRQNISNLIQSARVDSVAIIYNPTGDPDSWGIYQYINIGKIRQQGWESTASLNLGQLSLKGTYTWADSRVVHSFYPRSYPPGQEFLGVPTHFGNVTASYAHGGTSVTLTSNFVGANLQYYGYSKWFSNQVYTRLNMYNIRRAVPEYGVSRSKSPGYVKSDIAASQRLTRWASATVNVLNVGNSFGSEVSPGDPTLGRQMTVGLALRYP